MIKTIKSLWRVIRKVAAVAVFLFALIHSAGLTRGLGYIMDGGEFSDVGGVMIVSALITTALIIFGVVIWPGKTKKNLQAKKPESAGTGGTPRKKITEVVGDQSDKNDPLFSMLERGDIFGDGYDADQIPGAVGKFGLDVNNPIPVKSVLGAKEYLDSLTFSDGTKVKYVRVGSTISEYVKHPVDIYELSRDSGNKVCTIYLSPYHKRNSRKRPDFEMLENQIALAQDTAFTNLFEPSVDVQSVEGVRRYNDKLSKSSYSEICTEISNVMSAKHNLMFLPTSIDEYAEKQTLVTDLTDKALWICVYLFGQGAVSNFNSDNPSRLNELINALDEEVSKKDLKPEEHGAALLSKLEVALNPKGTI